MRKPQPEENRVANLQEAIEAQNREFMAAFSRGDAAGVAALYTRDARIFPPNSPMLSGREQAQQFWQGLMNIGGKNAALETVSVELKGDLAFEVGKYSLSIGTMNDSGKYVVVWKNEEGSWRLYLDIWNTSLPG
jgi:ketosteroid isomerase-like protein